MCKSREYWEQRIPPTPEIDTHHVARLARKSQRTVQRWMQSGDLPAIGRHPRRVLREDLIDFLVKKDTQP